MMMLHSVRRRLRQTLMEDSRQNLISLQRRLKYLTQQQFTFIAALDRCRQQNFEPSKSISTVSQVQHYNDAVTDNATDKRIFAIFLSLIYDLDGFRRSLEKLAGKSIDGKLQKVFRMWKKSLHPRQDISNVRARFPNDQINHLSCNEAKNHFGGIVSLAPFAVDCAQEAVERLEALSSSYDIVPPSYGYGEEAPGQHRLRFRPHSAKPRSTTPSCDMPPEGDGRRITTPIPRRPQSSCQSRRSSSSLSQASSRRSTRPQSCKPSRPVSAHPTTYVSQAVQTTNSMAAGEKPGKAVQTPNYLGSTLKPDLNWAHQTVSESEMRKMLKSRGSVASKPGWRP